MVDIVASFRLQRCRTARCDPSVANQEAAARKYASAPSRPIEAKEPVLHARVALDAGTSAFSFG
jgi:hypothetical protein